MPRVPSRLIRSAENVSFPKNSLFRWRMLNCLGRHRLQPTIRTVNPTSRSILAILCKILLDFGARSSFEQHSIATIRTKSASPVTIEHCVTSRAARMASLEVINQIESLALELTRDHDVERFAERLRVHEEMSARNAFGTQPVDTAHPRGRRRTHDVRDLGERQMVVLLERAARIRRSSVLRFRTIRFKTVRPRAQSKPVLRQSIKYQILPCTWTALVSPLIDRVNSGQLVEIGLSDIPFRTRKTSPNRSSTRSPVDTSCRSWRRGSRAKTARAHV